MSRPAAALAGRLAREAEAVCRTYLSNGRRSGRYWLVGDVANTPGRSLFVRLSGPEAGPGAAGNWTDAATGQHGDLLDLIGLACEHRTLRDTLEEARRFLQEPPPEPIPRSPREPVPAGSIEAARRLFAASRPVVGTLAETYLRGRGLTAPLSPGPLRFHPACYHRADDGSLSAWPALIAAITDLSGRVTGVHRTWLARDGSGKAPLETPRRAMGSLLGHGVRFGTPVLPVIDPLSAATRSHPTLLRLCEGLFAVTSVSLERPCLADCGPAAWEQIGQESGRPLAVCVEKRHRVPPGGP